MSEEVAETIALLRAREEVSGYDPFGFRPDLLGTLLPIARFFYRHYFRAIVDGIENIPEGRVLLIANHSGQIPFDGAMIATALLLDHRPPRLVRGMVERWVPTIPFVSTFFARAGQVTGNPENAVALLERGEALMVFPEGAKGISKTFDQRYQLTEFGLGFMRLAIRTRTPIVPIAVVGAEEQLPSFYNAESVAKALGMPALPLIPTLFVPLPVRYRIYFGEAMHFDGDPDDEDRVLQTKVDAVRHTISAMIDRGLRERPGIFA